MLAYLGEEMDPHVDACPHCRGRRGEYQQIAAALAQAERSPRSLPDGWMEELQSKLIAKSVASSSPELPRIRVLDGIPPALAPRKPPGGAGGPAGSGAGSLARVAARRRMGWFVGGGGVLATAAAMSVFLLWPRQGPSVEQRVEKGPVQYRGADETKHTGDVLHVTGRAGDADRFELRVYLDGSRLVFRCPGESPPDCRVVDDGVVVSYTLPVPGRYEVVWLFADSAIADPVGSLDSDVNAARLAGSQTEAGTPIDVD